MKRILALLLSAVLLVSIFVNIPRSHTYTSYPPMNLSVNGQRIYPDVAPFAKDYRTFVPVRWVFEKLGAKVEWVDSTQKVVIKYNNNTISLKINSNKILVNGIEKVMDTAPFIYNGRTMVPVRFAAENAGMKVQLLPQANLVTVTEPSFYNNLTQPAVLGFTTNDYPGDNSSYASLAKYYNSINSIATFTYQMTATGGLKILGKSQNNAVKLANSKNIRPLVLIHNFVDGRFDSDLAHSVLSSSTRRKAMIENLLTAVAKNSYSGVNIDMENVYWYDRQNYTSFIKELKERFSPYGFLTTVSIAAKTGDGPKIAWSGAYDYSELGKYADQILLMTYDEHYLTDTAGPIASYPWVENVLDYATKAIPASKILLGIAGYGYDWSDSGDKAYTTSAIESMIAAQNGQSLWDDTSKVPYYQYRKDGISHEIWYENVDSISVKLDLVKQYKLGGIGLWRMGYDTQKLWDKVKEKLY